MLPNPLQQSFGWRVFFRLLQRRHGRSVRPPASIEIGRYRGHLAIAFRMRLLQSQARTRPGVWFEPTVSVLTPLPTSPGRGRGRVAASVRAELLTGILDRTPGRPRTGWQEFKRAERRFVVLTRGVVKNANSFGLHKTSRMPLAALLGGVLAAMPLDGAEPDARRDATVEAVEQVMPSVVNIATETIVEYNDPFEQMLREFWGPYYRRRQPNTQYSLGSGVIIDEDGYVLTNLHVVRRAGKIRVRLADGREFEARRIVGNTPKDVALLKLVGAGNEKFTAVKFAKDDDLLLGETVLALGNPFGLGGSVSRGILSSKNRRPSLENEPLDVADWLQTDAAINPGSSGGPLINLKGELIGLNVAIYRQGHGIGFAIPIKQVTEAVSEIFTPEVTRSVWFGARIKSGPYPLRVTEVDSESPAAKAG